MMMQRVWLWSELEPRISPIYACVLTSWATKVAVFVIPALEVMFCDCLEDISKCYEWIVTKPSGMIDYMPRTNLIGLWGQSGCYCILKASLPLWDQSRVQNQGLLSLAAAHALSSAPFVVSHVFINKWMLQELTLNQFCIKTSQWWILNIFLIVWTFNTSRYLKLFPSASWLMVIWCIKETDFFRRLTCAFNKQLLSGLWFVTAFQLGFKGVRGYKH